MKKLVLVLAGFGLLLATDVQAVTFTIGSIDGSWSNFVGPGVGTIVNGVSSSYGNGHEDQVRWGTPFTSSDGMSGLGFAGNSNGLVVSSGVAFEVGRLRHYNETIVVGTELTSADLSITLSFSTPGGVSFTPTFSLGINETLNAGDGHGHCPFGGTPPCRDIISFPGSFSTQISGVNYSFTLFGFRESLGGPNLSELVTDEGEKNKAFLYGVFTATETPVPEPGTLLLLGSGLGLLKLRKRRGTTQD